VRATLNNKAQTVLSCPKHEGVWGSEHIVPLVLHRWSVIWRLGLTDAYTVPRCAFPIDLNSGSGFATVILNLRNRLRSVVSFTPQSLYPWRKSLQSIISRRPCEQQSLSGPVGEEGKLIPVPGIEPKLIGSLDTSTLKYKDTVFPETSGTQWRGATSRNTKDLKSCSLQIILHSKRRMIISFVLIYESFFSWIP
jgi:hypothetical protein